MWYWLSTTLIVICGIVCLFVHINRTVAKHIEPLARRVGVLEQEKAESDTRYAALQKLYENLQRRYDELMARYEELIKKYNLLQSWAMGLRSLLPQLKPDYPDLPDCIELPEETGTRYKL